MGCVQHNRIDPAIDPTRRESLYCKLDVAVEGILNRHDGTGFGEPIPQSTGGAVGIFGNLRPKGEAEDVHAPLLQPSQYSRQAIDLPRGLRVVDAPAERRELLA